MWEAKKQLQASRLGKKKKKSENYHFRSGFRNMASVKKKKKKGKKNRHVMHVFDCLKLCFGLDQQQETSQNTKYFKHPCKK